MTVARSRSRSRRPAATACLTAAHEFARAVAHRRSAPALHPRGVMCAGTLRVPGTPDGRWRTPWLDRPGAYAVTARWSRALGLPGGLPDGLGLALRVEDADGAGTALDLLLTSSGAGRLGRHVPLPRFDALSGPYSTLVSYRTGQGPDRVLAVFPAPGGHRPAGASLPALRRALARAPLRFTLCAAAAGEPWRPFAALALGPAGPQAPDTTVSYDPYAHSLPELRPTGRLSALREAAYSGSRIGRRQGP